MPLRLGRERRKLKGRGTRSFPRNTTAMHLFLAVLGGRSRGCHIEQHDVRFVVGHSIEDTLPELRRQWFGLQRGLHLDSWQRIERVQGWRLEPRPEPCNGPQRLWFVNLGAYAPDNPAELHAFGLFVATSGAAASARAKRHLLLGAVQQHKDDLHPVETGEAGLGPQQASLPLSANGEVDDLLRLERLGGWHLHLLPPEPGDDTTWQPLRPDWFGYRRLDR